MAEDSGTPVLETGLPADQTPDGPIVDGAVQLHTQPLPDDVDPAEVQHSEEKVFGVPLAAFVKGGTTSSAHDRKVAEDEADAEERRDAAAAERRIAREHGIHQGNPADVASMYSSEFTNHSEIMKAFVPLTYMGRGGKEVHFEGVGDIIMPQDPKFADELALLIFCPKCKENLPAGQAIITIRQSNRKWHLDTSTAGEMFVFEGQAFRQAGTVEWDDGPFTCPKCPWKARVDGNRVLPA